MKLAYLNICRLLASSGYHERDIAEFMDDLLRLGPRNVLNDISDIRRMTKTMSPERISDVPSDRGVPSSSDTAMKIERLLIHDAGISRAAAVELLSNAILLRYPNIRVPAESRKGFHSWIQRLITLVPEKDLLHIATNIRNRWVHDSPTDWHLK